MGKRTSKAASGAIVLVLVAILSCWPASASEVPGLVTQARALHQSCHLIQALATLQEARRQDPHAVEVTLALASLYNELKDHAKSLDLYRKVLIQAPHDHEAQVGLACQLAWMKQAPQAISICERLIHHEHMAPAQVAKARIVLLGAQAEQAYQQGVFSLIRFSFGVLPALRRAEAIDPDSADVHFALGRFYLLAPGFMGGDARKAVQEVMRASQLDPGNFTYQAWKIGALEHAGQDVQKELADYQANFGTLSAARQELRKALKLQITP